MMADEGASSSSNSVDEVDDRQECQQPSYTSSFTSHVTNDSGAAVSSSGHITCGSQGMVGMSRLSCNPFAIKTSTPTRSVADSTDNKESRPLVAPPTLKLGNSDSGISTSAPKIVLRPSALSVQAEKLKLMNKHDGSKQEGKENSSDESNVARDVRINACESNGKISKAELFASGISTSTEMSGAASPSKSSSAENTFSLSGKNSDDQSPNGSFIFGQNLHERALNYDSHCEQPLSPTDTHNLTFEEAALKKEELEKMERQNQEENLKSLSESAKEYESKQVKRKFDEVTVITGEEEESNVLQINCKLFAFDKINMNWQERGRGILRLNDREHKGHLHSRVVMRTQGSLRVVLNTKVWAGMSVEHPSQKTVRLTAFDPQGVKVFLVMAQPKDAEQLFNALDWRVTGLRSREDYYLRKSENQSTIEEATSSSTLPDASCDDSFHGSPIKRSRTSESGDFGADSSTEISIVVHDTTGETGSDGFADSTDVQS
ncbi:ran-binding protein 3-like isoform X1 [Stegodyphus dumicola]|uniref:ran-binding protein 3-like isoform X1 n=1 Tax=Stegodyphus dumicola TaxID=202533 RepID=UPI0015AEC638|nr:ran-binding protein 3-like isoform X1 [Stegodyphus dumicola]